MDNYEEVINECKDWIASRKAWIDQVEKRFEDQYPNCHPYLNRFRLEDIEAQRFRIEIHEYELEQLVQEYQEVTDEDDSR
jgi:hypothetical protein